MKSLYESIITEKVDEPEFPETLYDCVKNHIINFTFKRSTGPSHYPAIVELNKVAKKEYKMPALLSTTGKKGNPAILTDIFANIASQVKIDWKADVKDRLDKASELWFAVRDELMKQVKETEGIVNIFFDVDPVVTRYGDRKTYAKKSGVALTILVKYMTGEEKINIDMDCPLFK